MGTIRCRPELKKIMVVNRWWWRVFITIAILCQTEAHKKLHEENESKKVPVDHVEGVAGHRVSMPCDIQPRRRDEAVYMILWFREGAGKPLYSFDVRGRSMVKAKTWSSELGFDKRAHFEPSTFPAYLIVENLKLSDQGVYRCRVDFRNSPTRNSQVNLTVVAPPSTPVIYDGSGTEIMSTIGPYIEGSDVLLTCRVSGGKPEPTVLWYVNGMVEDSTYHMDRYGEVINEMLFRGLSRSHLNSNFSCKANNTKLIPAVEKTVFLELNLKPLYVRIRQKNPEKTIAGQEYRITCETAGSKPPAKLRWYKGGYEITQVTSQELDDGNKTVSSFIFVPTPGDNGASITCRAENPWLNRSQNHILEEVWNLNVVYAPEVKLSLGSTLNPMEIKEGTDVYFECKIQANPKTSKLVWLFNGDELKHNVEGRIIMSNQSLVLQGINRKATGNYTCIATNAEGSTHSNAVFLSVMYTPVCLIDSGVTVGAAKGETIALRCAVEANPTAFRFDWEFHGAGENIDVVPDGRVASQGDLSRFFHTPNSDAEFGTFLCWGSNDIGRQVQPCVFHVVAAVKPHILENCTVMNQSMTMIHVECNAVRELPTIPNQPIMRIMNGDTEDSHQDPTLNGLFREFYVMEVWDLKNRSLRRNLTAETPNFMLKGLLPGSWLRLILYAANSHGKSDSVIIETVIPSDPAKITSGGSVGQMELFPFVALGVGTACVGTLIVFILALVLRSKMCTNPGGGRERIPGSNVPNGNGDSGHGNANNSHTIVEKSGSVMRIQGSGNPMTNNSTHVSNYRGVPNVKHEINSVPGSANQPNKPSHISNAANPDIIPGANNFSSNSLDFKDENGTLKRHNRSRMIPSDPSETKPLIADSYPSDPLRKMMQIEYEAEHGGGGDYYRPETGNGTLPKRQLPMIPGHQKSSMPQIFHNNFQHVNKNDYNTIYIRDKLLLDSDIPESCV